MLHYQNHHRQGGNGKMSSNESMLDPEIEFDPNTFKFEEGEGLKEEDLPANHNNEIC